PAVSPTRRSSALPHGRRALPARRTAPRPVARRRHRRAVRVDAGIPAGARRQMAGRKAPQGVALMATVPTAFEAFRIHDDAAGYRSGIERVSLDQLSPGDVVIEPAWSSVNFKDALAGTGKGKILRRFPLVGGIDVAGHVVASTDPGFREGDPVLVTGCGLSETRDGGYSKYARLEARWA